MKYYQRLQWDKSRPINLKLGFICALGFVLMAFSYSVPIPEDKPYYAGALIIEDEITPPITMEIPKKAPPPPAPKIIENIAEIIDQQEFVEEKPIVQENVIDQPVNTESKEPIIAPSPPAPKLLPPEPEPEGNDMIFADRMPTLGDCSDIDNEEERKSCTAQHLLSFVHSNVKYPAIARESDVSGTVVVAFVVDKSGEVRDIEIMRDIGAGCGNEVLRVVKKLKGFLPGKHNGRPVSVVYRIPVKFDLK